MKKRLTDKIIAAIVISIAGIFLYYILSGFNEGNGKTDEGGLLLENVVGKWTEENGVKYYLDLNGKKLTGEQLIDNLVYYFDDSGIWNGEEPTPAIIISVQQSDERKMHISLTGGKTWLDDEKPECYMTVVQTNYPKDIDGITVIIHNNSDSRIMIGEGFRLFVWSGKEWIPSPADGLHHNDEGYPVQPAGTLEMFCDFQNKPLKVGRYKLIKEIQQLDGQFANLIFSVEFELM